ncbi:MAG: ferritin family protein [Terriglobales bacterium]
MGFDQYHEPPDELPKETRTFARMIQSLIEEAQAINWYEQRMAVEKDAQAKAIMRNAQEEEFKHFGMDLEFLLRQQPKWRAALKAVLFSTGDIVERGEKGEKAEHDV